MSSLVISLDLELFWGVTDSKTIDSYGKNILGVYDAVPAILELFEKYGIRATWATVGMLMCKDHDQWRAMSPEIVPQYCRDSLSTYNFSELAKAYPKYFFGKALIEQILALNGQELASHSYSHFYVGESSASLEAFEQDIECTHRIFGEYGVCPTSFVFPRNQVNPVLLATLAKHGFTAYRGNQDGCLYRSGSTGSNGKFARIARIVDDYLPVTRDFISDTMREAQYGQMVNIPATRFLRPSKLPLVSDRFVRNRVKRGMRQAALEGKNYHLWWHPHNFGIRLNENISKLEDILKYYKVLSEQYRFTSNSMSDLAVQT